MGNIQLSYSTFGLTNLPFAEALNAVDKAGYRGVEISFHRDQFNPFDIGDEDLALIRRQLDGLRVKPACVATASHFFTPSRPHEPSLMAVDIAGRKRRIDLVKRGIHVARQLGVNLVTFGSGFIREEHVEHPSVDPRQLLVESIHECVRAIRDDEDMTLLIEPEPGMYIETLEQGLSLVDAVNSPRFKLHVDLCHAWCSETDCLAALTRAAPHTRYLHISDAPPGYNLKIVRDSEQLAINLDFASTLVYFPDSADYLLVDRDHPLYFSDAAPTRERQRRLEEILAAAGVKREYRLVDYPGLYAGVSPLDDEIFTYLISVPGLSYDVLERAKPIIGYLRGARNAPLVEKRVANTLTGITHFHEIPGSGVLDLAASFKTLVAGGFSGYGSVELYHHVESWEQALADSHRHLAQLPHAV
jgi:sugar phosphate isomerase/epimerase